MREFVKQGESIVRERQESEEFRLKREAEERLLKVKENYQV